MADDPNRDLLPVKEEACYDDTCRSLIGPRERRLVCKLDRYELEDKYLRLLEEANHLKKISNSQEDKIKRLVTKLTRVSCTPRTCAVAFGAYEDKNKIVALEVENSKLRDKVTVLRNQLLNHTLGGRFCSRSSRSRNRPSSGIIMSQCDNEHVKTPSCHCLVSSRNSEANDGNNDKDYAVKIEDLEMQKKDLTSRIAQLEKEIEVLTAGCQREKVAENVECIRVWRQMKQLNDKLIAAQDENESLNAQINDLKKTLDETTKSNQELTVALENEKKRVLEAKEEMLKANDSQLILREKDERIRDLIKEKEILQQHNNELMELSNKYGQVEQENVELKQKIQVQSSDQDTLKSAFTTEQANIAALQAANKQLLDKLHELQKNIDSLTVQLMRFKNCDNKSTHSLPEATKLSERQESASRHVIHDDYTASEICKKCCETYDKILQLEKAVNTVREDSKTVSVNAVREDSNDAVTNTIRNESKTIAVNTVAENDSKSTNAYAQTDSKSEKLLTKEQGTETRHNEEIESPVRSPRKTSKSSELSPIKKSRSPRLSMSKKDENGPRRATEGQLSRKQMLEILDQAQIGTPSGNMRIRQDSITNSEHARGRGGSMELAQRHRQVAALEKMLFGDSNC